MKKTQRNIFIVILIVITLTAILLAAGFYFTVGTCAAHANTSQKCVQSGPFWRVVENPNLPTQ